MLPVFLLLLIASAEANLSISVPRKEIDDPNIPFSVACDFTAQNVDIDSLVSITLAHKGTGDTDYKMVLGLYAPTGEIVEGGGFTGVPSGQAQVKGGYSTLKAEYKNPSNYQAGEYRCTILGKDKDNNDVNLEQTEVVTSSLKPTGQYPALVQRLMDLNNEIDKVEEHTKYCERSPNYWFEAMHNITSLINTLDRGILGTTEIFEGSFYIFAQRGLKYDKSVNLCSEFGGYLVEINTEDELKFLQSSFQEFKADGRKPDFKGLLTGTYFPASTGRFKFKTHPDDTNVYLGHWDDDEPDKEYGKNYIILKYSYGGLLMVDDKPNSDNWGVICEISRDK